MTTPEFCVRLPFLRGPLAVSGPEDADAAAVSAARSGAVAALLLWPGLPQPPQTGVYCPTDYPFAPREAAACLEDLRHLGDAALSGLPVGAAATGNARAARRASEMALLRELGTDGSEAARKAEAARKERIVLEQAQKALLWAWLQEERMAELADMARALSQKSENFARSLGVDTDETSGLCPQNAPANAGILGAPVSLDLGLMPPWQMVTANALYFLPAGLPVLAEGPLAEALLEEMDCAPAEEGARALGAGIPGLLEICAPAWKVLGRQQPTGALPLDVQRLWLVQGPAS